MSSAIVRSRPALLALTVLVLPATAGEPAGKVCPLSRPPVEAIDQMAEQRLAPRDQLPPAERRVLERAWELNAAGKPLPDELLVEAILFAGGVETADRQRDYRDRLDRLTAAARAAASGARDGQETADRLLRFLHAGPLKAGADDQSSLATVLDTGRFNCVSASALYYVVGTRLGLDLRVVEIRGLSSPVGHATLDLVDRAGRVQVETTSPDGFDWAAKLKQPGVVVPLWAPDRKDGREGRPGGLAAMTYSNRGAGLAADPAAASRHFLAALCLDPTSDCASHNLSTVLTAWGSALAAEDKYPEAFRVLAFGHGLCPKDNELRWGHTRARRDHVRGLLDRGRDAAAVAAIAEAGQALLADLDFRDPADWFANLVARSVEEGKFEAALTVAQRGIKVLDGKQAEKLRDWRGRMFRLWSQDCLSRKDCDGSMRVLARAHALDPTERNLRHGQSHHTHRALGVLDADLGRDAAVAHFRALREAFPTAPEVPAASRDYAAGVARDLAEKRRFADAVTVADRYADLFVKPADRAEVGAEAFGDWARHLLDGKDWPGALAKYAEGLKAYPGSERLRNRARRAVQDWAEPAADRKDWAEIARLYRQALDHLTGDRDLKESLAVYESRARDR